MLRGGRGRATDLYDILWVLLERAGFSSVLDKRIEGGISTRPSIDATNTS